MAPAANKRRFPATGVMIRYGVVVLGACLLLSGAIYASQRVEQFLVGDPHFQLPGPPDYGLDSPNVELHGIQYASRAQVLNVFAPDYGRSLYFLPLAERRHELLGLRWVHDASILRTWPNRLRVDITERKPVAFIKVPAESMTRWALIDDDGVILDPPQKAPFRLPVLAGVLVGEPIQKRATRVRRMRRLMQELGSGADRVSEVDTSDLDNLKVTEEMDGRSVTLWLGDQNFSTRMRSFHEHYPDIHRKLPRAVTFDLRLDDRITGLEAPADAR
jgi:cell division protein FtsQ